MLIYQGLQGLTLSNFWKLENEVKKYYEKGCKISEV